MRNRSVTERLAALAGVLAVIGFVSVVVPGCEREGPAERTGQKVDQAAKKAGENIEQAGKEIQRSTK